MNVGIIGAGNIARAYFAFLTQAGHSPLMWSPSGKSAVDLLDHGELYVSGAFEGRFRPAFAQDIRELAHADVIILALPASGHKMVLDAVLPHLRDGQNIIISAHLSFAALYLAQGIEARRLKISVMCWNTTAMTSKSPAPHEIRVGTLRKQVDVCTTDMSDKAEAIALCKDLFGSRFADGGDLIENALTNLNPQVHLAMALCNLTRIETGEEWRQNSLMTASVARFLTALDAERCAIASGLGRSVRSQLELSGTPEEGLEQVFRNRVAAGTDPLGPINTETRYITEDVPYGLVPLLLLARIAGVDAPLHQSGVAILSACHARDYRACNDLLPQEGTPASETLLRLAKQTI